MITMATVVATLMAVAVAVAVAVFVMAVMVLQATTATGRRYCQDVTAHVPATTVQSTSTAAAAAATAVSLASGIGLRLWGRRRGDRELAPLSSG